MADKNNEHTLTPRNQTCADADHAEQRQTIISTVVVRLAMHVWSPLNGPTCAVGPYVLSGDQACKRPQLDRRTGSSVRPTNRFVGRKRGCAGVLFTGPTVDRWPPTVVSGMSSPAPQVRPTNRFVGRSVTFKTDEPVRRSGREVAVIMFPEPLAQRSCSEMWHPQVRPTKRFVGRSVTPKSDRRTGLSVREGWCQGPVS